MPEIEPIVTAISYAVSCLPEGHRFRKHFTVTVTRGVTSDEDGWSVQHLGEWYDADGEPSPRRIGFDKNSALSIARRLATALAQAGGHRA